MARNDDRSAHPLWAIASTVFLLSGCSLLTMAAGSEDRSKIKTIQAQLKCGMTIAEVEAATGARVVALAAPYEKWTHTIHRDFASLWLAVSGGRVVASDFLVLEGLKNLRSERELNHCG
jgi:hypothetical protein